MHVQTWEMTPDIRASVIAHSDLIGKAFKMNPQSQNFDYQQFIIDKTIYQATNKFTSSWMSLIFQYM